MDKAELEELLAHDNRKRIMQQEEGIPSTLSPPEFVRV